MASPEPGVAPSQRMFYSDDVCALKSDPSMVGIIDRTFYDVETHEPLDDILIVSHAPVPEKELLKFLDSGVPAKGYVFVTWGEPTQGSSLVHEDDIELLDRSLEIGHLVKRHLTDTVSGTVISISVKYSLLPVAFRPVDCRTGEHGALRFTEHAPGHIGSGDQQVSSENERDHPRLLPNIPAEELIFGCDEFCEGAYIIYRDKVGIIQQVDRNVILLLPNQTVVSPLNPYVVDLPLSLSSKPIVSLPNNHGFYTPWSLGSGGSDLSIQSDTLYPGQFIRTTHQNIRRGQWISGSFSEGHPAEAHVLATPPIDIHVDWICSNVFSVANRLPIETTSEVLRATRLQGKALIYDSGKLPIGVSPDKAIKPGANFTIGDRVRFRDPASGAVKYPDFDRIPKDQSFGHDVNIFKIVSVKSEVTVQWQDLSITTETSISLHKFFGLENEVWPGELVSLRDELRTLPNPNRNAPEILAYTFDPERNKDILRPKKIGVVQKVNSQERIASVRWFKDPKVDLLHNGNVLRPSSILGKLGDEVIEVSMYELTTHPGLAKSRGEMVLLVPEKVHESILYFVPRSPSSTAAGPCLLSYVSPLSFSQANLYLDHIKNVVVKSDWFKNSIAVDRTTLPPLHSVRRNDILFNSPVDWIGHIISLGIDGTITVRLGALQPCRDIHVPLEKILMVLDEDAMDDNIPIEDEEFDFLRHEYHALIQSIEYEGGERLDGDTDDDLWLTEDEEFVDGSSSVPDVVNLDMAGDPLPEPEEPKCLSDKPSDASRKDIDPALSGIQVCSRPPNFAIQETPPPSDHHFLREIPSFANAQRLRRIRKEHQILESSLPPGIFARTWESRIDLLRVVIIGSQGTPYEYAPFVIDLHFDDHFPNIPPASYFHSWTDGIGRINPNMYEDGKICLSILGTWPPKNPDENWNAARSTVLQILVSIMGLVLVRDPFYNEAGFEAFASEGNSRMESVQYTEKAFVMTRGFIKYALQHPVPGFEDVLVWHYFPGPVDKDSEDERPQLLTKAISEANAMIDHYNSTCDEPAVDDKGVASSFVTRLSLGAVVMLRKHIANLEKILSKILSIVEEQNNSST